MAKPMANDAAVAVAVQFQFQFVRLPLPLPSHLPSSSLLCSFLISTRLRTKRKHIKCAFKSTFLKAMRKCCPHPTPLPAARCISYSASSSHAPSASVIHFRPYATNCGNSAKWPSLLIANTATEVTGIVSHLLLPPPQAGNLPTISCRPMLLEGSRGNCSKTN